MTILIFAIDQSAKPRYYFHLLLLDRCYMVGGIRLYVYMYGGTREVSISGGEYVTCYMPCVGYVCTCI